MEIQGYFTMNSQVYFPSQHQDCFSQLILTFSPSLGLTLKQYKYNKVYSALNNPTIIIKTAMQLFGTLQNFLGCHQLKLDLEVLGFHRQRPPGGSGTRLLPSLFRLLVDKKIYYLKCVTTVLDYLHKNCICSNRRQDLEVINVNSILVFHILGIIRSKEAGE